MFEPGDLGALPPDWADRMMEVVIGDEMAAVEGRWIVACVDPCSGSSVYSGPYASSVEAMAVIDWEHANQAHEPRAERFRFELMRLHAPTRLPD